MLHSSNVLMLKVAKIKKKIFYWHKAVAMSMQRQINVLWNVCMAHGQKIKRKVVAVVTVAAAVAATVAVPLLNG